MDMCIENLRRALLDGVFVLGACPTLGVGGCKMAAVAPDSDR